MTDVARGTSARAGGAVHPQQDRSELRLEHVTMIRRGLTLVEDLSVTVAPGQTLAVTGASGTGKTTLLRAISGLSDTDAGSISRPTGRLSQVFQEPRLIPWYSAHRNISLVVGGPTPDLTAVQWLERVGLASAGHTRRPVSRAACGNGSPSPGHCQPTRACFWWTSPSPPWIAPWPRR